MISVAISLRACSILGGADAQSQSLPLDISNAVLVAATEYIAPLNGDFDLDGDVDFPDFIGFTTNFGKKGPAPSQGFPVTPLLIRIPVSGTSGGIDTIEVIKRDTIEMADLI